MKYISNRNKTTYGCRSYQVTKLPRMVVKCYHYVHRAGTKVLEIVGDGSLF